MKESRSVFLPGLSLTNPPAFFSIESSRAKEDETMKVIKVESDIYKKAEMASKAQGVKTNDFIARALKQGLEALNEKKSSIFTGRGKYRSSEPLKCSPWTSGK